MHDASYFFCRVMTKTIMYDDIDHLSIDTLGEITFKSCRLVIFHA